MFYCAQRDAIPPRLTQTPLTAGSEGPQQGDGDTDVFLVCTAERGENIQQEIISFILIIIVLSVFVSYCVF